MPTTTPTLNEERSDIFRPVAASLGSLAAVAAWSAASKASGAPVISTSVVNVPVTNIGFIDIDGSGIDDFWFWFDNANLLHMNANDAANGSSASVWPDGFGQYFYSEVLADGATVDGTLSFDSVTVLAETGAPHSPAAVGLFSTGVEFKGADNLLHYGWIQFNFPDPSYPFTGALAVSAGWETTPGVAIVVPEPAVIGGLGVVLCVGGLMLRRRLRASRKQPATGVSCRMV